MKSDDINNIKHATVPVIKVTKSMVIIPLIISPFSFDGRNLNIARSKPSKTKSIELKGIEGEGIFHLHDATQNIKQALSDAEIILIYYVSNFHRLLAEKISPYLKNDQLVYLCPGYAGSLFFLSEMKKINNKSDVLFVEGETLPFTSRLLKEGVVCITSKNYGHPIASLPKHLVNEAARKLSPILGNCILRNNILETSLHNPNLIMHTIGIIMNAGRIESSNGNFVMYTQGFTNSIWKIVRRLDKEKMVVMTKIGGEKRSYFDEFLVRTYQDPGKYTVEEGFNIYANSTSNLKTKNMNTRYITEDVPIGLGLLHSLGKHLNIPTPTCDSLIHLASIMLDTDYFDEARTIESLGFKNVEDLLDTINK